MQNCYVSERLHFSLTSAHSFWDHLYLIVPYSLALNSDFCPYFHFYHRKFSHFSPLFTHAAEIFKFLCN